jgi:rhamnose transport system permease protein
MKNEQVGALAAAVLVAALLIASGNWMVASRLGKLAEATAAASVARSAAPAAAPNAPAPVTGEAAPTAAKRITIGMMPKNKGEAYFISCREGAEAAAKELGVDLIWDGPTGPDAAKQNEVVEAWITKGVNAIAVSVENQEAISTVLRKARAKGIGVLTWDADADKDARDFFINQATEEGIGTALMDEAARILNGKGDFAIITASLTAANQNTWIKYIKQRLAAKYPGMKLVTVEPCNDKRDEAFRKATDLMKAHKNIKLLMPICSPAVPGAAEAVQQAGRRDVHVTGLSLPSLCKSFIKSGVCDSIVLWKTTDLGYLTVYAADALAGGKLKAGDKELAAGKLGKMEVKGDQVLLGKPFIFNKTNIDQFNF